MNLFELADSLPNGLHDAELLRIVIDYLGRTISLDLEIWVSESDTQRELYRAARITLRSFVYFVIEAPDARYPLRASSVTIDLSEPATPLPDCESGSAFRLFIGEFNAFIHGAAPVAELEWLGPPSTRGG
jgi:hypothetical protein